MSLSIIIDSVPILLAGVWLTLIVTISSFLIGQVLALPLGLARASTRRWLSYPAFAYTGFVRGSPLLVQLFIIYYGVGQLEFVRNSFVWPVFREPVFCAILAISLNSAAYVAELIAGAIRQLSKGQFEAAETLGLRYPQTLITIVLPQIYRVILPPIGNELTLVLKASSLASTVTILEITGTARTLVARTYAPFEIFTVAGVFYLIIGVAIGILFRRVEKKVEVPGLLSGR